MSSIIEWFAGKKTYLAMVLLVIAYGGRMFAPDLEPVWQWFERAGIGLGGVGLADKVRREVTGPKEPTS